MMEEGRDGRGKGRGWKTFEGRVLVLVFGYLGLVLSGYTGSFAFICCESACYAML